MSQVTNLAFFRARSGQSGALGAALAALVEATRLEAECLNYDLHRSVDDADVWFVYEAAGATVAAGQAPPPCGSFASAPPRRVRSPARLRRSPFPPGADRCA